MQLRVFFSFAESFISSVQGQSEHVKNKLDIAEFHTNRIFKFRSVWRYFFWDKQTDAPTDEINI